MNDALDISPEVAMGAASTRTEAEVREQRIGEAGQRAFLGTIDTAGLIFLARSKVQELNQRNYISSRAFDEELIAECLTLTNGNDLAARLLASAALED